MIIPDSLEKSYQVIMQNHCAGDNVGNPWLTDQLGRGILNVVGRVRFIGRHQPGSLHNAEKTRQRDEPFNRFYFVVTPGTFR